MWRGRAAVRPSEEPIFAGSLERGLQLVVGIVIAVKTVAFGFEIAGRSDVTATVLALAAVVIACVGTAAYLCLRGRPGPLCVVLATVALVAGCLLPRDHVPLPGASDSPILHLVEPMLLAILAGRRPAVLMLALDVLFVVLRWVTGGTTGLGYGVQEAVFITGTALGALVLVRQMRAASGRAERALAAEREGLGLSRAEIEATAALHDDVIPGLLALTGASTRRTRAAAQAALEAIGSPPTGSDTPFAEQLRALVEDTGLDIRATMTGRRMELSPEVFDALAHAVRESLRNVARHSGTDTAYVHVVRRRHGIKVTVTDHGVGFRGGAGVGQRVAMTERMRAVGGTVRIESAPGAGTTVTMAWRAPSLVGRLLGWSPDTDRLIRLALGPPAVPALQPVLALAGGYLATAVILVVDGRLQPATYAGAVVVAGMLALLAVRMRRGPIGPAVPALVSLATAVILALVLPTVSVDGLGGLESWIIEFTALPAVLLAWVQPIQVTALMLVPNAAVITTVALHDDVRATALPHLLFVQPLNALFVAVIAYVCRRAGRVVAEATAGETDRSAATMRLLGGLQHAVVAALTAGASGEAPAADVSRLARSVRDCLYLPGPAHERLRAALDGLRGRGTRVETAFGEQLPASEELARVVEVLADGAAEQVTISTADGVVTLVVVPGVDEATMRALRAVTVGDGWSLSEDADATVITAAIESGRILTR